MTIRLALCLVVAGCSGRAAPPPEGGPTPTVGEPQPPATTDGGDAGAASPLGAVRVTPLPPPPPPERMPKLVFLAPKPSEAIPPEKADAFEVRLDVTTGSWRRATTCTSSSTTARTRRSTIRGRR